MQIYWMLQGWKRENYSTEETENYWCHCWPCCWSKSLRDWKRAGRTKKTESRFRKWSCSYEVRGISKESIKNKKSKWEKKSKERDQLIKLEKTDQVAKALLWVCDEKT